MPHIQQLDHRINCQLQNVYSSILDMRQFGEHHPYMQQVTLLQSTDEFTEYHISEMVWIFGFIPQWPKYTAKVFERVKSRHIQYTSAVKGGVDLKIDFLFSDNRANTTLVNEHVHLTGNDLVCKILLSTIKKAHLELFHRLEQKL